VLSAAKNVLAAARPPRCALLTLGVFVLLVLGGSSSASAEPSGVPLYDGGMTFAQIAGPTAPEEYSWEVQLSDDQVLEQIDERHAEVQYSDNETAFGIVAEPAHDADGSAVPTTLAVSATNIVTLTVHHRAGNPAAGGASFVYPVSQGLGWEGGFQTYYVQMPEPEPMPETLASEPAPPCIVPGLKGRSLMTDRLRLRRAGCMLGEVRGRRSRMARVVKQDIKPGTAVAGGTEVGVKLGG
jgi:hypothetical protein